MRNKLNIVIRDKTIALHNTYLYDDKLHIEITESESGNEEIDRVDIIIKKIQSLENSMQLILTDLIQLKQSKEITVKRWRLKDDVKELGKLTHAIRAVSGMKDDKLDNYQTFQDFKRFFEIHSPHNGAYSDQSLEVFKLKEEGLLYDLFEPFDIQITRDAELEAIKEENASLKKMYAELVITNIVLNDSLSKIQVFENKFK